MNARDDVYSIQAEPIDLSRLPQPIPPFSLIGDTVGGVPTLTIGDLHGNALKFIHLLIRYGIATGLDEADYQKLVGYYSIDWLHAPKTEIETSIEGFKSILNHINVTDTTQLRLLGDMLADRGRCDYLTLLVIEKLHEKGVPFEIIFSNHDAFALTDQEMRANATQPLPALHQIKYVLEKEQRALQQYHEKLCADYEKNINIAQEALLTQDTLSEADRRELETALQEGMIGTIKALEDSVKSSFTHTQNKAKFISMATAQRLIELGVIADSEYTHLFQHYYLPHLKLLSSVLSPDVFSPNQQHLSIFTHAPVGLETIAEIAACLCIPYQDETALELHQTIHNINQKFSEFIASGQVHRLLELKSTKLNPVFRALWEREDRAWRPPMFEEYTLDWYHGHTEGPTSLDNDVGKEFAWCLQSLFKAMYDQLQTLCQRYIAYPELTAALSKISRDILMVSTLQNKNLTGPQPNPFLLRPEPPFDKLAPHLHPRP